MSHSSKLMTLHAMVHDLALLKKRLSSESLTIEEYVQFFDFFSEIKVLHSLFEELRLILEVDDGQEAAQQSFNFLAERSTLRRRDECSADNSSMELSDSEYSFLIDTLRSNPKGANGKLG